MLRVKGGKRGDGYNKERKWAGRRDDVQKPPYKLCPGDRSPFSRGGMAYAQFIINLRH